MYFQITWPRLWHENNIKREEENLHNGFGQLNIDEQKTFLCLRKPICRNRALNFKQRKIYIQRNYYICSIFKYRNTVSKTYHFHLTPNEEPSHQMKSRIIRSKVMNVVWFAFLESWHFQLFKLEHSECLLICPYMHRLILKKIKMSKGKIEIPIPGKGQWLRKLVERAMKMNPHGFLAC